MFDVFRRYLEYRGYEVNYIVNITDIDDKIINKAVEENINFKAVARKYTDAYFESSKKLGVMPATVYPFATDNIDGMLDLIKRLIEKAAHMLSMVMCFTIFHLSPDMENFPDVISNKCKPEPVSM